MTLDQMIASLEKLGVSDVEAKLAKAGAIELQKALETSLAAGQTPEGAAWSPTKTGGRAYNNAASKLKVTASGAVIRATVGTPEAYAQFGSKRLPIRQMLPDAGAGMPKSVSDALDRAFDKVMAEALK